jgi:hypothetical protein
MLPNFGVTFDLRNRHEALEIQVAFLRVGVVAIEAVFFEQRMNFRLETRGKVLRECRQATAEQDSGSRKSSERWARGMKRLKLDALLWNILAGSAR